MNKITRILLVIVLLAGAIAIAGSGIAWATAAPKQPANLLAQDSASAPQASPILGTVNAPNCAGVWLENTEWDSICGLAVVTAGGSARVYAAPANRPSGYVSQAVALLFTRGSARICFAAPASGIIYFRPVDGEEWFPIATTIADGKACAIVSDDGDYAFHK